MLFNRPMGMPMGMPQKPSFTVFLLYVVFALYLLNIPFDLIPVPAAVLGIESWIVFAGGVLLIVAAVAQISRITRGY